LLKSTLKVCDTFMGEGTLNKTLSRLSNDLEEHGIDYAVIDAVALLAHGYPPFTEDIDLVMTTGEYPGDGKPKPVSMPEPTGASTEIDGIKFITLEKLIELKPASGMSAPDRLKDLADVQELIKIRQLDASFALKLNPYVRQKYVELEAAVRESTSIRRNNEYTK
jgi:hypothetical protein